MKIILFFSLSFLCFSFASRAQDVKIDYSPGAVSDAELEMKTYLPDTSASAVVLCSRSDVKVSFDSHLDLKLTKTVYKRYKVLKDAGKDCADEVLYYLSDNSYREVYSGIKVTTYNKENGKTVKSRLPSKLIFRDTFSDKYKKISFSAPDVRIGSVIEVQYSFSTRAYWDVGLIFMQGPYPVNHGYLSVEYANYFAFNKLTRGFITFTSSTTNSRTELVPLGGGESLNFILNEDVYVADNVPALKREPYCFYPDQSRLGVEYDLSSVTIPGYVYKDYNTSWKDVDRQFGEMGFLKEFNAKLDLAAEIKGSVTGQEDEEKFIETIRAKVLEAVKWNGRTGLFPDTKKAYKEKTGNAADICGVMASVLNVCGYSALPVLLKTRDKGVLASFHVSTDSFNAVILKLTTPSGKVFYTDVVTDEGYLNVLPVEYLVDKARVIPGEGQAGYWVDLSRLSPSIINEQVVVTLKADGSMEGSMRMVKTNENSLLQKTACPKGKEEEFAERLESSLGMEISDFVFNGAGAWTPRSQVSFNFSADADVSGDYIYVKPFLDKFHSEDEFKDPVRSSIIDFPFPGSVKYAYSITFPAEYAVEQMPPAAVFTCDPLGSKALVKYAPFGENGIMVGFSFSFSKNRVMESDYEELRRYWAELCNIYNTVIVLKKK